MERDERRVGEYGLTVATFSTLFAVATAAASRQGRLPERIRGGDIVIGGIATQKLARLVAKEKVTIAVRAPFTEVEETAPGEVRERPTRRNRLRHTVGELLLCPFCLAQWIAAAFALGLLYAPRVTRLVMAMNAMVGVADFLQVVYKAAENRRDPD